MITLWVLLYLVMVAGATYLALWIDEAVQGLAAALDNPALLESVLVIHRHNRAIRGMVFDRRDKIRSAR